MGSSRITQVIHALQVAGFWTARGNVCEPMPEPSGPVAAVYPKTLTAQESVVAVEVFTTAAQGGIVCEDAAMDVLELLTAQGAVCKMGSCSFNGRTGLFSVTVTAQFAETLPFDVLIDEQRLPYVTKIEISRRTELSRVTIGTTGVTTTVATDHGWQITLTEHLPADTPPEKQGEDPFSLSVQHPGGVEQYAQCCWEMESITRTPESMRRVRSARTWAEKIVAAG